MNLRQGIQRSVRAYEGSFGQTRKTHGDWRHFMGILGEKDFIKGSDGMARAMVEEPGRARHARSLTNVRGRQRQQQGMPVKVKEDMAAMDSEIIELNDTIADQELKIGSLQDQVTELSTPQETPVEEPTQMEPDEGVI